jgi:hypothetical protein
VLHAESSSTKVMVIRRALVEMFFICRYLIWFLLEIHATENTAAMSMLDSRHHPHKSVCLYTTSPASNLDAWLSV